ncbi:hypothetical protein AKO1_011341 [Acrasis kona]|uniref:Uncharacterized protein n=1 Tax=Acrasis kona TaxID=1008807 RepID=A0AAW2YY81_9EUKA
MSENSLRIKISALQASLRFEVEKNATLEKELHNALEETKGIKPQTVPEKSLHQEIIDCTDFLSRLKNSQTDWNSYEYHGLIQVMKAIISDSFDFKACGRLSIARHEENKARHQKSLDRNSGIKKERSQSIRRLGSIILDAIQDESDDESASDDDINLNTAYQQITSSHNLDSVLPVTRDCYVCKMEYDQKHDFYDRLCPPCAALNFSKRTVTADLSGRVSIVTGGRIRIGYQTALRLLRCNSTVIVTTRFPHNAVKRFKMEPDYESFSDRLVLYGLDLRDLQSIDDFVEFVRQKYTTVDILINNAAQTIRKPPIFYEPLVKFELSNAGTNPALVYEKKYDTHTMSIQDRSGVQVIANGLEVVPACMLSVIPRIDSDTDPSLREYFPPNKVDDVGDPLDDRSSNTWGQPMSQLTSVEMAEVSIINTVAPSVLITKLVPLMERSEFKDKYIINVSSNEGSFASNYKSLRGKHHHTNMAKSALNMLGETLKHVLAESNIFISTVDPGWVSLQCTYQSISAVRERGFEPPLDEVDAASRILDPVFDGVNLGKYSKGGYFKDYQNIKWYK